MPNLMPADIASAVRAVLLRAPMGKGDERHFMTSYQILAKLKSTLRETLIRERGLPGKGAGVHFTAARLVAAAAEGLPGIQTSYLAPARLEFRVGKESVQAGYAVCSLYRPP